ncbi:hypothetical protein, partial [Hominenteromicrobium sp.]|uniref:hypothetical protein n=1 Tax=Hominenteromicrobium sp. TaxID=3073581 RepID=UPI003AB63943
KTGELSLGAIQLQNSTAQLAGVMNQQLVPGLVEASEKKTALEDKMTELSGKLETVEIPDMTALKAQLGAGAEQVFDGAASGAAKAASEAAASNAATVASQKTAEVIKGNVQQAADNAAVGADQVADQAAALSTDVFQGGYKAALKELLSDSSLGLTEDQINAISAKIDAPASPSSEITDTVTAKLSGAATVAVKTAMGQVVNDIDSDMIASTVGPKVAEQVAPIVTEKVTSSDDLAAAKQSAVQQVAAAIPDINTDELKSLMGEFKDLSSQAGEMMGSVDTLTGALYNAENPADTDTVVGAANAISDGAAKLGSGASQLATGTSAFATGVGTLDAGTNQLLSGMETLSSSSKTVSNAIGQFQTGGAELKDGTSELSDGMTEFSGTINDKLDGLSEITDPDSTLARVIDIMKDRADSFKGSGRADGTDMTVSYVMRTATDSSSNSTSTTEETTTETETKDSFWNRVANLFSK